MEGLHQLELIKSFIVVSLVEIGKTLFLFRFGPECSEGSWLGSVPGPTAYASGWNPRKCRFSKHSKDIKRHPTRFVKATQCSMKSHSFRYKHFEVVYLGVSPECRRQHVGRVLVDCSDMFCACSSSA